MRHMFLAGAVLALGLSAQPAAATEFNFAGALNAQGYATFSFSVTTPTLVDLKYTGSHPDGTLNLFDSAGAFIIHNDDIDPYATYAYDPRITMDLPAGLYNVLVSTCCRDELHLKALGGTVVGTDGHNTGYFITGGTATLASLMTHFSLFDDPQGVGSQFGVTVTTNFAVPEPVGAAVLGMGLLGLAGARARRRAA